MTIKNARNPNQEDYKKVDSELEELGEQLPRYRPDSIAALRRLTRFTEPELKRLYRGFKAECPTGVVREETFKLIYSQFFPQGGKLNLKHFDIQNYFRG
ncbi:jg6378 [Pararge aegeria aegeria]|uniref:Jg6378 protein n=1 Tax=Pararge aegeria aegeria TaxID=348720 RepID=A0A8S4RSN6_9NEOP|nr:jg6378 [Pararge aegeria aegeria]